MYDTPSQQIIIAKTQSTIR